MLIDIQGYCPACGQTQLHAEKGAGILWCLNPECPDKAAAHKILADHEPDHILRLGAEHWTLRHPLRERLDDQLMECQITSMVRGIEEGGFSAPGKYRLRMNEGVFEITGPLP